MIKVFRSNFVLNCFLAVLSLSGCKLHNSTTLDSGTHSVDAADARGSFPTCLNEPVKFVNGVDRGIAGQTCSPDLQAAGCVAKPLTYRYQLIRNSGVSIFVDKSPNGVLKRIENGHSVPGATQAWKETRPCNCVTDAGCSEVMFRDLTL
jgi:hypothetical protein